MYFLQFVLFFLGDFTHFSNKMCLGNLAAEHQIEEESTCEDDVFRDAQSRCFDGSKGKLLNKNIFDLCAFVYNVLVLAVNI